MSNASVISSIEELLRKAHRREIPATQFDEQLGDCVSALEGLTGRQRRAVRDLGARFVHACFAYADYPGENPDALVTEIEKWLESVPK